MRRARCSAAALIRLTGALVLTAACGSAPEPSTGGPAAAATPAPAAAAAVPSPCGLITRLEAESAVGQRLAEPEETAYNPVSRSAECTFDMLEPPGAQVLSVRVEAVVNQAATVERMKDMLEPEPVEDLGDEAFFGLSQLFVFQGPHQLTVIVSPVVRASDARREAALRVARTILPRLGT